MNCQMVINVTDCYAALPFLKFLYLFPMPPPSPFFYNMFSNFFFPGYNPFLGAYVVGGGHCLSGVMLSIFPRPVSIHLYDPAVTCTPAVLLCISLILCLCVCVCCHTAQLCAFKDLNRKQLCPVGLLLLMLYQCCIFFLLLSDIF